MDASPNRFSLRASKRWPEWRSKPSLPRYASLLRKTPPHVPTSDRDRSKPTAEEGREIRRREHEEAVAARQHDAALKLAETKLSHARDAEAKARADWERAAKELDQAQRALADLRRRS